MQTGNQSGCFPVENVHVQLFPEPHPAHSGGAAPLLPIRQQQRRRSDAAWRPNGQVPSCGRVPQSSASAV